MEPITHVFAPPTCTRRATQSAPKLGIMRRETLVVVNKMDGRGCNVEALEA
jgi:hypothetical protein